MHFVRFHAPTKQPCMVCPAAAHSRSKCHTDITTHTCPLLPHTSRTSTSKLVVVGRHVQRCHPQLVPCQDVSVAFDQQSDTFLQPRWQYEPDSDMFTCVHTHTHTHTQKAYCTRPYVPALLQSGAETTSSHPWNSLWQCSLQRERSHDIT